MIEDKKKKKTSEGKNFLRTGIFIPNYLKSFKEFSSKKIKHFNCQWPSVATNFCYRSIQESLDIICSTF